jgi:hypothetical protein
VARQLAIQVGDIYHHTITRAGYSEMCAEIVIRALPEKDG